MRRANQLKRPRRLPNLQELQAGHDRIDLRYADVPAVAQITYTSNPALIKGMHAWFDAWFDAQVTDHGQHAELG
ncbi:hypothetical protein [Nonomuraea sp. KM90]|uniref:hypothetical protein n=1 Tax=Nonomuraea sp. KM90 TaxID=3457428 RepID=UPI003FCCD9A7